MNIRDGLKRLKRKASETTDDATARLLGIDPGLMAVLRETLKNGNTVHVTRTLAGLVLGEIDPITTAEIIESLAPGLRRCLLNIGGFSALEKFAVAAYHGGKRAEMVATVNAFLSAELVEDYHLRTSQCPSCLHIAGLPGFIGECPSCHVDTRPLIEKMRAPQEGEIN